MVGWMIAGTWPTQYQFRAGFKCWGSRNMKENLVDLTTERNAAATYLALLPGFGSVTRMLMDSKHTPKPLTTGHVNRAQSFHVTFPTNTVSSAPLWEEPLLLPVLLSPPPFGGGCLWRG